GPGGVETETTQRFGDMTWGEVSRGEVWRPITATFLHKNLLHLALNLVALVLLGRLVEPWYGPGPFLALCLALGALGNLLGGALAGAAVGFGHRPLVRLAEGAWFRRLAWGFAGLLTLACTLAQVRDARAEAALEPELAAVTLRVQADEVLLPDLVKLFPLY